MNNADTRKKYDEAMKLFYSYYLDMSGKDPKAGERFRACVKLLGRGSQDEIIAAYARHFQNDTDGMRDEAERVLRDPTAPTPFGMQR